MSDEIVKSESINARLARAMEDLSVNQALAMSCIMRGGTITAAAEAADVARVTLYEWLEPGEALYEAINIWKQDLATTARTRLLLMTDLATQNILHALKRGDAKLAMQLVQKIGVLDAPPVGPTRLEAVTERVMAKAREHGSEQTVRVRAASFVESWTEVSEGTMVEGQVVKRSGRGNKKGSRNAGTAGGQYGAVGGDERGDRDSGGAEEVGGAAASEATGTGAGDAPVRLRRAQTELALAGNEQMLRLLGEIELEQARQDRIARGQRLPDLVKYPETGYPAGDPRVLVMKENRRVLGEDLLRFGRFVAGFVRANPGADWVECLKGIATLCGVEIEDGQLGIGLEGVKLAGDVKAEGRRANAE